VHRAENLTTFLCQLFWNLGAPASWNPQDLSGLYRDCFTFYCSFFKWKPYPVRSYPVQTKNHGYFALFLRNQRQWCWSADSVCVCCKQLTSQMLNMWFREHTYRCDLWLFNFPLFHYLHLLQVGVGQALQVTWTYWTQQFAATSLHDICCKITVDQR